MTDTPEALPPLPQHFARPDRLVWLVSRQRRERGSQNRSVARVDRSDQDIRRTGPRCARAAPAGAGEPKQGCPMSLRTAWGQMIARCYDPKHHKYPSYGGRGIRVCDRWICFRLFAEDMGPRPPGMTLNRIDNNGPYSPENCEWASAVTQNRNRRDNLLLTHKGETLCVAAWAERLGVRREALRNRIHRGWPVDEALSKPFKGSHENSIV